MSSTIRTNQRIRQDDPQESRVIVKPFPAQVNFQVAQEMTDDEKNKNDSVSATTVFLPIED